MSDIKNILFIMCDQLRWDYLSCYGHPHLQTPHIDSLAQRGLRFQHAYAQAAVCGPSRVCSYTGRYVSTHGSTWNGVPLNVGEMTIGDHLRPLGRQTVLVGKIHTRPDVAGMARLGIDPQSETGRRLTQCGFDVYVRHEGMHPDPILDPELAYNHYLRQQGYPVPNPWDRHANGALDETGSFASGWLLRNAHLPANIKEEHSETPYLTRQAIDCMEAMGDQPWCIHLSYIKPHWPYLAPAPYHKLYGPEHLLPPQRDLVELENPHPIYHAFTQIRYSQTFAREDVRKRVIPTYMGLIKQLDDQIGQLLAYLQQHGYMENTLIVFTSDHGDYLGDHWLGEKDLFHEASVRVPLIIYDPSSAADARRGQVESRLVESIDLLPTFVEAAGGKPPTHILEGRSLLPLLHGQQVAQWREYAISELDYSGRQARLILGREPTHCRGYMLRTQRWKYCHYEGFTPQLFDLERDPQEFHDLGRDPGYETVRSELAVALFSWLRQRKIRTTISDASIAARFHQEQDDAEGLLIGVW